MPISDYIDDLNSSKSSMSYLDSSPRRQVQLPLAISWYTSSGTTDPNDLYTDNPYLYFVYSGGWHQTAVTSQVRDRYNGVTITLLEGGPVQLYVQAADSAFSFVQSFYGAPYTTSGDAGSKELIFSTYYSTTPENPKSLAVEIPSPGTYKIVFSQATDSQAFVVSHSGVGSYRVSQIIPRRAVQAYDIDVNSIKAYHVTASLIDTISLRVSESIVVGSGLIGAKSIDGSKIVDGTISGILMRDGTVTGNKVLAGTISGVLITASSITGNNIAANTITADKVTTSFVDTISAQVSGSLVIGSGQITDKSIDGRKIVDGTVSGVLIRDGTVTGNKIVAGTISGELITAGTITAAKITAGTITGDRIAATTISGSLLTAGTITFDKIASNTLTSNQIADGTITGQKIAAGTVSGVLITDNAVTASKISANTITGDKIAANTISGVLITAGTITADNIATRTITADRIVLSGIVANLLGPEAVTAAALAGGAVISGKLGVNSILANNVTAGIIQGYHVAADTITGANIFAATISGSLMTAGTITFDKIASNTLTSGQIADGTITGQKIVAGTVSGVLITDGTIAASKIAANTITASQIAANTITASQIAANTITASQIAANTITASQIAANTITASKIATGTITATEIAANTITANKLSISQLDAVAANMGTLTVNSGISVGSTGKITAGQTTINNYGVSVGTLANPLTQSSLPTLNSNVFTIVASGNSGNLQGIAMFNTAVSTVYPIGSINLDGLDTIEIANNTPSDNGNIHINFSDGYTGNFRIYNGNLDMRRAPDAVSNLPPGAIRGYADTASPEAVIYELSADRIFLGTYAGVSIFKVEASTTQATLAGDLSVSGFITHRKIGGINRTASQTIAAGTTAQFQLNVADANNVLGNTTSYYITIPEAGYYLISARGTSSTLGIQWNVRSGSTTGVNGTAVLGQYTQTDFREVNTIIQYFSGATDLRMYFYNTGASAISVTGFLRTVRIA